MITKHIFFCSGTIFWPNFQNPVDFMWKIWDKRRRWKVFVIVRSCKTWAEKRKNIRYVIRLDISSAQTSDVELFLQDGIGIWLISMSSCIQYFLHWPNSTVRHFLAIPSIDNIKQIYCTMFQSNHIFKYFMILLYHMALNNSVSEWLKQLSLKSYPFQNVTKFLSLARIWAFLTLPDLIL